MKINLAVIQKAKQEKSNRVQVALMISEIEHSVKLFLLAGSKDSAQRNEEVRQTELPVPGLWQTIFTFFIVLSFSHKGFRLCITGNRLNK